MRYTPQKVGKEGATFGATFLLRLENCKICSKDMVVKPKGGRDTFLYYFEDTFDAQAARAGFAHRSNVKVDDEYICVECAEAGKATFECALCEERKTSDKEEESFGDPPEFLCTDCYETVSAKEWQEKKEELHDSHRYDFC